MARTRAHRALPRRAPRPKSSIRTRDEPPLDPREHPLPRAVSARMHAARIAPWAALSALFFARAAGAQCVIEGDIRVRDLASPSVAPLRPMTIDQRMRATIRGARATVEGLRPLVFSRSVEPAQLALSMGPAGFATRLVSVAPGARVIVESAENTQAIVTVRSLDVADGIELRALRVPCTALTGEAPRRAIRAGEPAYPRNPRWQSASDATPRWSCTTAGGATACGPVHQRCSAVGDGSQCGYRPRQRALRLFVAPSTASESVEVTFSEQVSLRDDDGRAGWLLLSSRGQRSDGVVVRGWVPSEQVRFAQEVPHWLGRADVGIASGGHASLRARSGWVVVARDSVVRDRQQAPWARTAEPWCTRAAQQNGSTRIQVSLPGVNDLDDDANIDATSAQWVEACPSAP